MQTQCSADLFGFELPRLCARGAVRRRQHATSSAGALLPGDGSELKADGCGAMPLFFAAASRPQHPENHLRLRARQHIPGVHLSGYIPIRRRQSKVAEGGYDEGPVSLPTSGSCYSALLLSRGLRPAARSLPLPAADEWQAAPGYPRPLPSPPLPASASDRSR
jgi:hypothetical protein